MNRLPRGKPARSALTRLSVVQPRGARGVLPRRVFAVWTVSATLRSDPAMTRCDRMLDVANSYSNLRSATVWLWKSESNTAQPETTSPMPSVWRRNFCGSNRKSVRSRWCPPAGECSRSRPTGRSSTRRRKPASFPIPTPSSKSSAPCVDSGAATRGRHAAGSHQADEQAVNPGRCRGASRCSAGIPSGSVAARGP